MPAFASSVIEGAMSNERIWKLTGTTDIIFGEFLGNNSQKAI